MRLMFSPSFLEILAILQYPQYISCCVSILYGVIIPYMEFLIFGDLKILETIRKPARIPPQTPPAGGKTAEAGRIHIPSQLFRPAESALVLLKKSSSKVYNYSTSSNLFGIRNMERFCGSQNRALIFAKTLSAYGGSREIP